MARIVLIIVAVTFSAAAVSAQSFQDLVQMIEQDAGAVGDQLDGWDMGGAAGLLIEENPTTGETDVYAQLAFRPEFGLGKFAVGLDLTLNYNLETGELKESDFNEDEDYLKLVRYLKYGRHPYEDGIYLKVGALDHATIGHGFIINRYKTDVDYDNRRAGARFNLNYDYWGMETFTNNLFLGEVAGLRGVVRPMAGSSMPIVKDIGFGLTVATDSTAPQALRDTETYDVGTETWSAGADSAPDWDEDNLLIVDNEESLSIRGFDLEIPVLRGDMLSFTMYADYAEMYDVGSDSGKFSDGVGVGAMFDFKLTSGNKLYVKAEQRYMDRNFIPGYFNRLYEIERLQLSTDMPLLTKLGALEAMPDDGRYRGVYAEVAFELLGILEAWGTLEDNQDVADDGALQVGLGFKELAGVKFAATYTKTGIDDSDINDAFVLDDRSLFLAYLSYEINALMNVGTVFRRNWELDMNSGEFEPVDSYSVGVSFSSEF